MTRQRSNPTGFEQRLLATLRANGVARGQRLVVGFSGGYDSLALALALSHIQPVLAAEVVLAHVDHRLRHDSTRDAETCLALAKRLGLPIEVVALKPNLADRTHGIGLEEAARRERYQALADVAQRWNSRTLLLAHQANDQAETVLLHLIRGAGIDGLVGMRFRENRRIPWWRARSDADVEVLLLRPLLAESRRSIEAYVDGAPLRPVNDPTNCTEDFDRNWVRHQLLPGIVDRWPGAIETIRRSSVAIGVDSDYMARIAAGVTSQTARNDRTLRTDTLRGLDQAIAYRVIRIWLSTSMDLEVDLDAVDRIYALAIADHSSALVEVGQGRDIVVSDGELIPLDDLIERMALTVPIRTAPDVWDIRIEADSSPDTPRIEVPLDATLSIRCVEPGDVWFGTHRPVKEDLRRAGIHPRLRSRVLAITCRGGVLLIPAIYPTIRTSRVDEPVRRVSVRWSRRS